MMDQERRIEVLPEGRKRIGICGDQPDWRSKVTQEPDEARKLRLRVEVLEAQLRAWGKALEWYADPKHWQEQVDDRGRETLRWRWADDDGRMARHALDCWRQSEGAKVLRRADSEASEK